MSPSPRKMNRFVSEFLAIEAKNAKEAGTLAFMPRALVRVTLPHRPPKGLVIQRKNGYYSLSMIANPEFRLPSGSLPRLLLAWITREAIRTGSPVLYLGKTFSAFLSALNLSSNGGKRGDATRLKEQLLRLLTTHISCIYQNKNEGISKGDQFLITRSFNLWRDPLKTNNFSYQSTITLAKDFFEELIHKPIPVDFRVLQLLRRSPLQIDIYVWLTYRFSFLKKATFISWGRLKNQFGCKRSILPILA